MSHEVRKYDFHRSFIFIPTGSVIFVVKPFTSCKTDIIISHYNAGHTYTMQELVKEVTLKNHNTL